MTKHDKYAEMGMKALLRAAKKVAEEARKNNRKIPMWKNGHVVYEVPAVEIQGDGENIKA